MVSSIYTGGYVHYNRILLRNGDHGASIERSRCSKFRQILAFQIRIMNGRGAPTSHYPDVGLVQSGATKRVPRVPYGFGFSRVIAGLLWSLDWRKPTGYQGNPIILGNPFIIVRFPLPTNILSKKMQFPYSRPARRKYIYVFLCQTWKDSGFVRFIIGVNRVISS